MALDEITRRSHDVELDIAYATPDNFTGKPVYARAACYLHPDARRCLEAAIELARPLGLRLKLFDAFRPSEAQSPKPEGDGARPEAGEGRRTICGHR